MGIVFADVEGDDLYPAVSVIWTLQIALGPEEEVEVFADQPGYRSIKEGLKILKEADFVVFHNGLGYDFFAINKLYPGTLRREQIIDTLVISRFHNPEAKRHSLDDLGEAIGYKKGSHTDFSKFSEEMVKYGIRDVHILQKMWMGVPKKKVPSFKNIWEKNRDALDREFLTAFIIQKQMNHGFRFDVEAAIKLEAELRQEKLTKERELQEIFPPLVWERWSEKTGKRLKDGREEFNPGSRDQIASRLINKYGWEPLDKTPTGKAKVDEDILESLPYPEAKEIARYMKLGKQLGQLSDGQNAWLKQAKKQPDGTYYLFGYVNTLGTRTTRMSHSKPNVAQADGSPSMRSLFLPDKGHVLVGVDADGLELRMLAHFLYPYDDGLYARTVHEGKKEDKTDIHTMNQLAAGLFLRSSAKTMIYAHNYGCGDKKLGIVVIDDAKEAGQELPTGSLSKIGKELRGKIETRIGGLGSLIAKCKKIHERKEAVPGLDGRWIKSASAHSSLNTLLQGNGSIVMKEALNVFEEETKRLKLVDKFDYCANVHDEFQLTSHPDYSERIAALGRWSIEQAGRNLGVRCPLVGSSDIGKSWADTH